MRVKVFINQINNNEQKKCFKIKIIVTYHKINLITR